MGVVNLLQSLAMAATDAAMALWPRPLPSVEALEQCRIIAHRGERGYGAPENTLDAFCHAADAGCWGLECDIRFTADLVPVICHDETPRRVFGRGDAIAATRFADLRAELPDIPSLQEVVSEFGGRCHLMLELKAEIWPQPEQQSAILQDVLSSLQPIRDYHLLALAPALFERVDFAPSRCFLPVAEVNVGSMSEYALNNDCAGLGGHYLLLGRKVKQRHDDKAQRVGTGFPTSGNCLRRELNRGIEWIFTNHPVKLERLRREYLALARERVQP